MKNTVNSELPPPPKKKKEQEPAEGSNSTLIGLLACPFCGSRDSEWLEDENGIFIDCDSCEAQGPTAKTVEGARKGWNKRAG